MGGVSFSAQLVGTLIGVGIATVGGFMVYGILKAAMGGLRLTQEEEYNGADLTIHKIKANPDT